MIKNSIYILLTLILAGCEDFLDKNPDSRADLDTPDNISALLVSAYPEFSHIWFTEVMSDNTTDVGPTAFANDQAVEQAYYWTKVDGDDQDSPDGYWYSCYNAIASANAALEAIKNLEKEGFYSQSVLNPLRAEALMCRAYVHFMLANLFAEHYDPASAASEPGIPYVTEVETKPIVEYQRQSVEYVYKAIENDFQQAYDLISDNVYDAPKWHFNKQAAATFISRYYLYRGFENDWDSVIHYTEEALGGAPESYLRDWLNTSDQSFDVFGKNYSRSTVPANFLIQSKVSTFNRAWYHRHTMDLELLRERAVYGDPHPTRSSITNDFVFINKAGGSTTAGTYGVFKFVEEFRRDAINANYGIPFLMYPTIVAEEALFNQMESYVMKNDLGSVIDLLNLYYSTRIIDFDPVAHEVTDAVIRNKYDDDRIGPDINPHFNLTADQEIYLRCLIHIRASEFVSEGHRWFDIKRMHIEVEHDIYDGGSLTLTANDPRRVIDLPEDVGELEFDNREFELVKAPDNSIERLSYKSIMKNENEGQ